jgi:hypothetical protein
MSQQAPAGAAGGAPASLVDPLIVCGAFRRNRFFLFSRREPAEVLGSSAGTEASGVGARCVMGPSSAAGVEGEGSW